MIELTTGVPVNIHPTVLYMEAGVTDIPSKYDYPTLTGPDVPGLVISRDMSSGIIGTPTAPGTYEYTIKADDAYGTPSAIGYFTLKITAAAAPEPPTEIPGTPTETEALPVKVCKFLGLAPEGEALALAEQHTRVVTTFVHGYTRGRGFTERVGRGFTERIPNMDLADVIISATARYVVNPQQAARQQIGDQSILYASLEGFTLAEKAVLHRYRRRTA